MNHSKNKLFIDATSLIAKNKSGVGMTLKNLLDSITKNEKFKDWDIFLIYPMGKRKQLSYYESDKFKLLLFPLPARIIELLNRIYLLPPVDWIFGKGVYLFPNYRNWPLWKSKSITYIYDVGFLIHPETLQPKNLSYMKKYVSKWVWRTDRIVTITNQVKYEIERLIGYPANQISTIYCGVDSNKFYRRSRFEIKTIKARYDIKFDKYIIFVGNIEPRKNLVNLIKAFRNSKYCSENNIGLVIVGSDGWLNSSFIKIYNKSVKENYKIYKVNKYVKEEDLPAIYSGSVFSIQPAIYEGFGLTNLEAMATKTIVALSDISAMREIVKDCGFYFDPMNIDSISNTIDSILKDNIKNINIIKERGYKRALELSWSKSASELMYLIESEKNKIHTKKPIIRIARIILRLIDNLIRLMCRNTPLQKYVPIYFNDVDKFKKNIISDYKKERPNNFQQNIFNTYIKTRTIIANIVRKILK